ncbi:hypothetical protein bpmyx0001_45370 [Bacillus pseudomycoides DSM 12442]|nr:hypothetical protein bpmyx0001_45370 [Bacillus pseudomycoides DSM 12442]
MTIFDTEGAQTGELVHRVASSCKKGDFLTVLQYVLNKYKNKIFS